MLIELDGVDVTLPKTFRVTADDVAPVEVEILNTTEFEALVMFMSPLSVVVPIEISFGLA